MFSISSKNKPTATSNTISETTEFAPVEIHVPPARFLPNSKSHSKGSGSSGNNTITIILISVFVLVLAGGIFAWFFFKNKNIEPEVEINVVPSLTIDDNIDTPVQTEEPVTTPPTPITYISKNSQGNVDGIVTLQLSAADRALAPKVKIDSESTISANQYIIGSAYSIDPLGVDLEDSATLTLEYFDTNLSSSLENSLRIAFLNSSGNWQLNNNTVIDLNRNQLMLDITEIPSTFVAIVSNLTMDEISLTNNHNNNQSVVPDFELENLVSSFDTDEDGLSDIEEILLGSNIDRADTDLDGYTDGDEVKNLYSPTSIGTLLEAEQFLNYTNTSFNYSLQYPASWSVNNIDPSANVVLFNSATNQFIEVLVEKLDPDIETIQEWYKTQVPGLEDDKIRTTTIGPNNYFAILSVDGTTVYFMVNDLVFGIVYNKGIEEEVDYLTIWEAMKNSFVIPEVANNDSTNQDNQVTDEIIPVEDNVEINNIQED